MKQILIVLMLFSGLASFSQDSHYWNLQYGAKATLLGGAVIGSVTDLSATYYNPGAISLFEDPKVILSAKVYQYEEFKVVNGAGNNKDLDYSGISPAPTFVAFKVKIDSTGRNKLAFSVLTRQSMSFEFETKEIETDGAQYYTAGGLMMNQNFDEIWAGASFSHKVNNVIGLGLTSYIAYRNQTTNYQTIVEELMPGNEIASLLMLRKLKFENYRALFKAGMAINLKPVTLGLTITTPSINILGDGSYNFHNIMSTPDDASQNVYESNTQPDLKSEYNTSWAVGMGGAYWGKKFNLHVSAEWFNKVKKYQPLDLASFTSQSSGEMIQKEINQQFKSILNAGVGVDYIHNDKISFASGITTDFSANVEGLKSNISLSTWDIYHLSAGTYFKVGSAEITLGLSYSSGSDNIKQIADIDDPNLPEGSVRPITDVDYTRIKVLFGFVF
jgi:hypothetical protein